MEPVAVTGTGAVTAAGLGADALWRAVREGRSSGSVPREEVAEAARRYRGLGRLPLVTQMACLATAEAVRARVPAGIGEARPEHVEAGIVMGTVYANLEPIAAFWQNAEAVGPAHASPALFPDTVLNAPAGHVAIYLGLHGPTATISAGRLSGALALAHALDTIAAGQAERLVACGAETRPPDLIGARGAGEGAGAVVVERDGGDPLAEIRATSYVAGPGRDAAIEAATRAVASAGGVGGAFVSAAADPRIRAWQVEAASRLGVPVFVISPALGDAPGVAGIVPVVAAVHAVRERTMPDARPLDGGAIVCLTADAHGACALVVGTAR